MPRFNMQPDLIRLRHMLEAAEDAVNFAHDRMREDLDRDRMLALAIIKSIEIIGEAASKITEDFKSTHGNIPWDDIVNMRHRLTLLVLQTIYTNRPKCMYRP